MNVDSQLLQSDEEYRRLVQKHQEMEARLNELAVKSYLSEHEQLEEVTLKKRKLLIKDQITDIVRRANGGSSRPMSQVAFAPPQG